MSYRNLMPEKMTAIHGISWTRYCGPQLPDNEDRTRYQITNRLTGEYVTLSLVQMRALAMFIMVTGV